MRLAKLAQFVVPALSLALPVALIAGQPFVSFEQPCQKTLARKQVGNWDRQQVFYPQFGEFDPRLLASWDRQQAFYTGYRPFESDSGFTEMMAVPTSRIDTRRPSGTGSFDQAMQVVQLINQERQKAGLRPLTVNPSLQRAAANYAAVLAWANKLSHTFGGTEPGSRARAAGYRTKMVAENIAMGYPTARSAVSGWMKSTGHRKNILNPRYRDVGVGVQSNGKGQLYWVVNFGTQ